MFSITLCKIVSIKNAYYLLDLEVDQICFLKWVRPFIILMVYQW